MDATFEREWLPWTEEEDRTLFQLTRNATDRHGDVKWSLVSSMPTRSRVAMQRRMFSLKHDLAARQPVLRWSAALEDRLVQVIAGHRIDGHKIDWVGVAAEFPGRSINSLATRYYTIRRRQRLEPPPPAPVSTMAITRPCLTCGETFESPDRKRVWICDKCKHGDRRMRSRVRS